MFFGRHLWKTAAFWPSGRSYETHGDLSMGEIWRGFPKRKIFRSEVWSSLQKWPVDGFIWFWSSLTYPPDGWSYFVDEVSFVPGVSNFHVGCLKKHQNKKKTWKKPKHWKKNFQPKKPKKEKKLKQFLSSFPGCQSRRAWPWGLQPKGWPETKRFETGKPIENHGKAIEKPLILLEIFMDSRYK